MRSRRITAVLLVVCVVAMAGLAANGAQKVEPAGGEAKQMSPEMEAWAKLAAPGEGHKRLAPMVGTFTTKAKFWMAPGAPPEEVTGTSTSEWVLDGRYVHDRYESSMAGEPFNGLGLTGYDNQKKQYVTIWVDTMSTAVLHFTGQFDASGKVLTMKANYTDPMSGKDATMKTVCRIVDANTHVFEGFNPGPDGKEMKSMEITYTRK